MWIALFVFAIGLCVGSFLNVVIFRTNVGWNLGGRSKCMACKVELAVHELIPVLSFIKLKGKCNHCGIPISVQYPIVEFVTGVLFVAFYFRHVHGVLLPDLVSIDVLKYLLRDLLFVSFLVVVFVYDLRYYLILDRFTIPAIILAVLFNLWTGMNPVSMLLAAAVLAGFFLIQYGVSQGRWIGGGDIRMGLLMGAMLGWPHALLALFISYGLGAIVGLFLLGSQRAEWRTQIPFGTFLALGTIVTLLWGDMLLQWYLGLLGF